MIPMGTARCATRPPALRLGGQTPPRPQRSNHSLAPQTDATVIDSRAGPQPTHACHTQDSTPRTQHADKPEHCRHSASQHTHQRTRTAAALSRTAYPHSGPAQRAGAEHTCPAPSSGDCHSTPRQTSGTARPHSRPPETSICTCSALTHPCSHPTQCTSTAQHIRTTSDPAKYACAAHGTLAAPPTGTPAQHPSTACRRITPEQRAGAPEPRSNSARRAPAHHPQTARRHPRTAQHPRTACQRITPEQRAGTPEPRSTPARRASASPPNSAPAPPNHAAPPHGALGHLHTARQRSTPKRRGGAAPPHGALVQHTCMARQCSTPVQTIRWQMCSSYWAAFDAAPTHGLRPPTCS
jgi:hypothetical protein